MSMFWAVSLLVSLSVWQPRGKVNRRSILELKLQTTLINRQSMLELKLKTTLIKRGSMLELKLKTALINRQSMLELKLKTTIINRQSMLEVKLKATLMNRGFMLEMKLKMPLMVQYNPLKYRCLFFFNKKNKFYIILPNSIYLIIYLSAYLDWLLGFISRVDLPARIITVSPATLKNVVFIVIIWLPGWNKDNVSF